MFQRVVYGYICIEHRSLYMLWEDESDGQKNSWKEATQVNGMVQSKGDAGLN